MKRYTARPSPFTSTMTMIIGIFMLIFGIVFFSSGPSTGMRGPVIMFMVVWIVALIGIIIYHASNAFGKNGVPTTIIDSQDVPDKDSPRDRLEQLEALRRDHLISEAEYQAKRSDIVNKL
jgi:hypothetical protein